MSAEFTIHVEPERDLVRIWMKGLFEEDDLADFLIARAEAHKQLRCEPNAHVTLNDVREMKIQPQTSVAGFKQMLNDPTYCACKHAFVVAPTLARAQLMRAIEGRGARVFDSVALAETWLFADDNAESGPMRAAG